MTNNTPIASLPYNGLMLWEVVFESSYYDNDARMPGTVPVGTSFFVLATSYPEALRKVEPLLASLRRENEGSPQEVKVNLVVIESLVPARKPGEARFGYIHTQNLVGVDLSLEEDKRAYRLGVCLIPTDS